MRRKDELRAHLLATFRSEAEEHLEAIRTLLPRLHAGGKAPDTLPVLNELHRIVHTLKGAARSVGLREIETICQALEGLLRRLCGGEQEVDASACEWLRDAALLLERLLAGEPVAIAALIERLSRDPHPAGPELTGPTVSEVTVLKAEAEPHFTEAKLPRADTVRVGISELDGLLVTIETLLFTRLSVGHHLRQMRALVANLESFRDNVHSSATEQFKLLLTEARSISADLAEDERALSRAVTALQDEARGLRLQPASVILEPLPEMVRELAAEVGKEVELVLHGALLPVDRRLLEALKDPLIHVVRNAIDHGIEVPEIRQQCGKPPKGSISISLAQRDNQWIDIEVTDDGRGIDLEALRLAATRSRLVSSSEAATLEEAELINLLFKSGFSTAPVITHLSGQGLGLTIARERVERLGGEVRITTRPQRGTTTAISIPAAISTSSGLLVRAGDHQFLLPLEAVCQALRLTPDDVHHLGGCPSILFNGQHIPIAGLERLLGLSGETEIRSAAPQPCVVITAQGRHLGLLVTEVIGDHEILVKPLEPPLTQLPLVSGAGILGSGRVVLILRPSELLLAGEQPGRALPSPTSRETPERRNRVLVVDDSITTRTMERNMLEAAGYQVQVAVDGLDAWALLKTEPFDLVVSDVDMPRLDGFALTSRIRGDAALQELPVVLVTAMESREDRERGILVGANAYVIKSRFDESNLLEIIRRLI